MYSFNLKFTISMTLGFKEIINHIIKAYIYDMKQMTAVT